MNKKMLISAAAAVTLLLGVSACGSDADSGSDGSSASEKNGQKDEKKKDDQQALPKPDLKGIPAVVAVVNGEEISKDEFVSIYQNSFQQQAMSGGKVDQDQLKKQTANTMVETELLVQEATRSGFEASEKDIDKELQSLAEQRGMKPEQFLKTMSQQGMDEDVVRAQLEDQLQVTDFVEDEAGDVKPTEKELRDYYDELVEQQKQQGGKDAKGSQIPPFKDVKDQLEQQMVGQKQGEIAAKMVKDLKKDAKIEINV